MAKKVATPAKQPADNTKQLVDAIITVKHLQEFINEHGGVEKAVGAVDRVSKLVELTGGVAQLKQALEIVGQEPAPPQA